MPGLRIEICQSMMPTCSRADWLVVEHQDLGAKVAVGTPWSGHRFELCGTSLNSYDVPTCSPNRTAPSGRSDPKRSMNVGNALRYSPPADSMMGSVARGSHVSVVELGRLPPVRRERRQALKRLGGPLEFDTGHLAHHGAPTEVLDHQGELVGLSTSMRL